MNDKMSDLIKAVFEDLGSLDEKEFKENLKNYYKDPLTEIFLHANKLSGSVKEFPFPPSIIHIHYP